MYDNNCGQERRKTSIDFLLPLYVVKALHNDTENAEQICIRTVVKGFCTVHFNKPFRSITVECPHRSFDVVRMSEK